MHVLQILMSTFSENEHAETRIVHYVSELFGDDERVARIQFIKPKRKEKKREEQPEGADNTFGVQLYCATEASLNGLMNDENYLSFVRFLFSGRIIRPFERDSQKRKEALHAIPNFESCNKLLFAKYQEVDDLEEALLGSTIHPQKREDVVINAASQLIYTITT